MKFDYIILKDKGFRVEFSNQGDKRKTNPVRFLNLDRERVRCAAPGCDVFCRNLYGTCKKHKKEFGKVLHEVDWIARIISPGETRMDNLTNAPPFSVLAENLRAWAFRNPEGADILIALHKEWLSRVAGNIPDATSWQEILEGAKAHNNFHPLKILKDFRSLLDEYFPFKTYEKAFTPNKGIVKNPEIKTIPLRVTLALLLFGYICEESNRGDLWHRHKKDKSWKAKYAGCFLSAGHLLYRMHTNASNEQIRMCLRG